MSTRLITVLRIDHQFGGKSLITLNLDNIISIERNDRLPDGFKLVLNTTEGKNVIYIQESHEKLLQMLCNT